MQDYAFQQNAKRILAPELIRGSKSIPELYVQLHKIGSIQESQQEYSSDDLIEIIQKVRSGEFDLDYVTNTYGLREVVGELLSQKDSYPTNPVEGRDVGPLGGKYTATKRLQKGRYPQADMKYIPTEYGIIEGHLHSYRPEGLTLIKISGGKTIMIRSDSLINPNGFSNRQMQEEEENIPEPPKMNIAAVALPLDENGETSTVRYNDEGRLQQMSEEKREEDERRRRQRYIASQQKMRRRRR